MKDKKNILLKNILLCYSLYQFTAVHEYGIHGTYKINRNG